MNSKLNQIHDRELKEHRRARLYLMVLGIAIVVVVTGVAWAIVAIARTI